jgi:hypothetical protein
MTIPFGHGAAILVLCSSYSSANAPYLLFPNGLPVCSIYLDCVIVALMTNKRQSQVHGGAQC